MLRKNRILLALAALFVSSVILVGSKVEANLDLFLDQFDVRKVEVNGIMIEEDEVPAFVVNGRTVLPLRKAAEMLNAIVQWDEGRRVVMITKPIVNMTIINRNRDSSTLEVNPSFKSGRLHSFEVVTEVSRVPISKDLKTRFIVADSNHNTIYKGNAFTIDTAQFNGAFKGSLNVVGLELPLKGEYVLKLQIEDPENDDKFITIGEYVIHVN